MKLARMVAIGGVVMATLGMVYAQDAGAAKPARLIFDVATIKPSAPPPAGGGRGAGGRGNVTLTPGDRFTPNDGYITMPGVTVLRLIAFAWSMDSNPNPELKMLPDWAKTERFDITARASHPASKNELRQMVKSLLEDRFGLVTHYEVRNVSAYEVVQSKPGHFGPQMREHVNEGLPCENQPGAPGAAPVAAPAPAPAPAAGASGPAAGGARGGGGGRGGGRVTPDGYPLLCGDLTSLPDAPPGRSRLGGRNVTMATFMATANGGLDRPAIDKTGLTGRYDWWIEYVPDAATDGAYGANFANPDPTGAKLWTAFKEQLGLEFKSVKTDVNWLIFDQITKPTEN